jgi:cytochrome oxidase assembly protein ShyY1
VVSDPDGNVRVVGFARYDSDRGGAQEDDRIGGNERRLREILRFASAEEVPPVKVVFLNDGPGLLLGSMWADYAAIENGGEGRALVTTLKMAQAGRFSVDWIASTDS